MQGLPFFPQSAATIAPQVDHVFFAVLALSTVVLLGVLIAMFYFLVKFRDGSPADRVKRASLRERRHIEYSWTLIPLGLFLVMFAWAADVYVKEYTPPKNALEIYVIGKQWMWKTQHPEGRREINELHVPVNQNIKLIMTSQDVIHSFYVPEFRIKHDILPGRYVTLWFQANKVGDYHLFCAEYCGTDHASMIGHIVVMTPDAYARWLAQTPPARSMAVAGEALFRRLGCSGCHGASSQVHAPKLEGIFGKPVALSNGSFKTADESYVRDSILLPQKDVVAGYAPIMPSFAGQVTEADLLELVAYVKSLADKEPPP